MKLILITPIALTAGVPALVIQDGGCTFKLTAAGGASGYVSQLGDGQNRVGAYGLAVATYTMGAEGGMFDRSGRGCILTPPTTQFQCDVGASPTSGFSIGCDGTLSYNDNSHFVACQTGDNSWNVYTTTGLGQTGCVDITLNADSCGSDCAPASPSSVPPSPVYPSSLLSTPLPSPPPSSPSPTPKTCPADLSGIYEFPHLIVPVSSSNPNTAYGTSYNGQVSRSDIRTIFTFDIPAADARKTCSLVFLFPRQDQLQTSAFTISGDGIVGFGSLAGVVHQGTTYNTTPAVAKDYGIFALSPGKSYSVATFDCPAGTTQSYSMTATGTDFYYFQDYNPSP
jgi:Ubiquitin 3 binding protein But2 C-terminal domain